MSRCTVLPRDSILALAGQILTADERHFLELLLPLFTNQDFVVVIGLVGHSMSLLVSVADDFGHVFGLDGVEDVEYVGAIGLTTLGELIWEKHPQDIVALDSAPHVLHTELIILRYVDCP